MTTKTEQSEEIQETLQDLREDVALLQLALLGAQAAIDRLTLSCLLRLSDYLKQHVRDLEVLCGKNGWEPSSRSEGVICDANDR